MNRRSAMLVLLLSIFPLTACTAGSQVRAFGSSTSEVVTPISAPNRWRALDLGLVSISVPAGYVRVHAGDVVAGDDIETIYEAPSGESVMISIEPAHGSLKSTVKDAGGLSLNIPLEWPRADAARYTKRVIDLRHDAEKVVTTFRTDVGPKRVTVVFTGDEKTDQTAANSILGTLRLNL